ncbi:hypothetical protein N2152v2_007157 [Parachlorella kessleri]
MANPSACTDRATVSCEGAVGWVSTSGGVVSLADAANQTRNSSAVEFTFTDITLTADAFVEAAKAVLAVGGGKAVDITLSNVTMNRQSVYLGRELKIPGGASYAVTLDNSNITRNQFVAPLAFASNGDLNIVATLAGSQLSLNQLVTVSAGLVRGLAGADLGLNSSVVEDNQVLSLGALAISGNASAVPALLDSSVTNNMLTALGLLALGGNGTFSPKLQSSQVADNVAVAKGLFVEDQGLVAAVVGLIARFSFNDPSINLGQLLGDFQTDYCQTVPANSSQLDCGALCDILRALRGPLCSSNSPSLAALAPTIDSFIQSLQNTPGLSFNNLLARLGNIQNFLLPLLLPLVAILQNLSPDKLFTPQVVQPVLSFILQVLSPL